jgi:hypothetical protein
MKRHCQSAFRAVIAVTLAIGLLLLLVSPATAHHGVMLACYLSLPILFLGMIEVPRVLGMVSEIDPACPSQFLEGSSLFQRPPPVAHA